MDLPTKPTERDSALCDAIRSVGLPEDAPWAQVVSALNANGLGDLLPVTSASATEETTGVDAEEEKDAVPPEQMPNEPPPVDNPAPEEVKADENVPLGLCCPQCGAVLARITLKQQ